MIDLKKRLKYCAYILLIVVITFSNTTYAIETTKINAISAILLDKDTGRVLWEKNGYEERAMASTTKIMTCIIALEYASLDEIVLVSEYAARAPIVKLHIKPSEEYILEDLLYTLMLISSNDVAIAIAEHIGGSVEEFCDLMTKKAREIGALNTSFKTSNGLDAEGHYSTAYDLALITRYALNNEKFKEILTTTSYSFTELTKNRGFDIQNKNSFLNIYYGANGVKTGFTNQAGYCFVGSAKKEELELIVVVLGSGWPPNRTMRWNDCSSILNYGFENYETHTILKENHYIGQIEVIDGIEKNIDIIASESIEITYSQEEKIDIFYQIEPEIIAPVLIGQIVGKAQVYVNGQFYYGIPLLSNTNVKKIDFMYCFNKVLDIFLLFAEE